MNVAQPLTLYPFRKRDPLTGKWYRARWQASLAEIESHAGEWMVDGPPTVYPTLGATSNFQSYRAAASPRSVEMHPQRDGALDELERFLARLFLRRYVTYCARRSQFQRMNGAVELWRELHSTSSN